MKIKKHARGNYYTTITIKGEKKFIYGSTPGEVEEKYIEMKYKKNQGYDVLKNPLMSDYMATWYKTFKDGKGAIETQNMYRNCINCHINPALGKFKLKSITATQTQKLLNSITSSKSLAHKVRITLNQIFKQAIADRIVTFNPMVSCELIAPDKPKRIFLNPIQRELMLEILKDHKFYPLAFCILYSGIRRGEALALTWNDIDFENKVIKISKALEFENSKPKLKEPKSKKGYRDIPMNTILINYLKEYKSSVKSLYVFPGHAGGLMGLTEIKRLVKYANKVISKWFNNKDNIEFKNEYFNLTFRSLRHTYCTGLYDAGVDEVSAAEIMGHDVLIMREIYTHIQEQRKVKTAIMIESLYMNNDYQKEKQQHSKSSQ